MDAPGASEAAHAGRTPGRLIAIGGAEDKTRERIILRHFLDSAGATKASVVVLATASEIPETGQRYADLFEVMRARRVEVLKILTREDALGAGREAVEMLERATGLFLTGGSQIRLSSTLGGTAIAAAIRRRHAEGLVVAGTSAGASLLSEHMIAIGDGGGTPRRRLVHLAQGLGLTRDVIIDQHFRRRDRLGRLLTALSYNPAPIGLGVDEDTAAIIDPDGMLRVLGAGAVTVVDASRMRFTNSYAVNRGQPLAMLGLHLDFLTTGCRYDLKRRIGYPPTPAATPLIEEIAAPAGEPGE